MARWAASDARSSDLDLRAWSTTVRSCVARGVAQGARARRRDCRPLRGAFVAKGHGCGGRHRLLCSDAHCHTPGRCVFRVHQASEPQRSLLFLRALRHRERAVSPGGGRRHDHRGPVATRYRSLAQSDIRRVYAMDLARQLHGLSAGDRAAGVGRERTTHPVRHQASDSRLLDVPAAQGHIGRFDPGSLCYPWTHPDAAVDRLHAAVLGSAATIGTDPAARRAFFNELWRLALDTLGADSSQYPTTLDADTSPPRPIPWLSEPWFCCAEPTERQLSRV
jgi:hypothetical protein